MEQRGDLERVSGEPERRSSAANGEIPHAWVYWSVAAGLALALLVLILAETWPVPHSGHRLNFADAFNIAWKVALFPPGIVTARIAVDRINLSKREHQHAILVAHSAEFDATQRRITELSAKASDQLGSDRATVRIGGLTDLERLGANNPDLRQSVIDRICAYLQMSYTVAANADSDAAPDKQVREAHATSELSQEMRVRLIAQRIIARHTRFPARAARPPSTFWPDMSVDLSGATLIDFDMGQCRVATVDFGNSIFYGRATFIGAAVVDAANFAGAAIHGPVLFDGAQIGGLSFEDVEIDSDAVFRSVTIRRRASFDRVRIGGALDLGGASLRGSAYFRNAIIGGSVEFSRATIDGGAAFSAAKILGGARFNNATIGEDVNFGLARFGDPHTPVTSPLGGIADFQGAVINGNAVFHDVIFSVDADFTGFE
jgi:uncharacterized protein YjbI with pentapeptide repeats